MLSNFGCRFSSFVFSRHLFSDCRRPPFFASIPSLFMCFSLLLILSQFICPTNAFILQELPLYRNVRNQRHTFPPSPAKGPLNAPIGGETRRPSFSVPMIIQFEGGTSTIFMRPSRAFNFHRLNRLQDFWHRNQALRRMAQMGNSL